MVRELVTVQEIKAVSPIEKADAVELVSVMGWECVVKKSDNFHPGDKVAYFETDSLLPESNPIYADFMVHGVKTMYTEEGDVRGHVLKTVKLRGVYSQGIVMRLDTLGIDKDSVELGDDVTERVGVVKYEAELPMSTEIIGKFDESLAPITDCVRLQNLAEHWGEIKSLEWDATIKVDGTSQTVTLVDGKYHLFSRNYEIDPEVAPGLKIFESKGLLGMLEEGMAVQFELAGTGINGNKQKINVKRPYIFAIWKNGVKIPRDEWSTDERFAKYYTPVVDFIFEDDMQDTIDKVSGISGNITKDVLDEGIVFHLKAGQKEPMFLSRRANFKIISNKYLLKHGI